MSQHIDFCDSFVNLKDKTDKLIPILKEYDFDSIIRAVFTITSWRNNRGSQESCLALNNAVCLIDSWGNKQITTFETFISFFDTINPILQINLYDDPVLIDFGEIKLCFKNKYYSVITGTGHTAPIFADLQFLEDVSKSACMDVYTENILDYSNKVLAFLSPSNSFVNSEFSMMPKFECPSEEYFSKVNTFFADGLWYDLSPTLLSVLAFPNNKILKSHFVLKTGNYYPLFNPSLLVDYFTNIVAVLSDDSVQKVIKQSLASMIRKVYCYEKNDGPDLIENILFLDDRTPINIECEKFAYIEDEHLIVFLNTANDDKHLSVISQIEQVNRNNSLSLVDLDRKDSKNCCRSYKLLKECKIHFVLYDNHINVDETIIKLNAKNDHRIYSAIDLMYIIMVSDSLIQLVEFEEKTRNENTQILSFGGASDYYTMHLCEKGFIAKGAIEYINIYSEIDTSAAHLFTKYIELNKCFPFHLSSDLFSQPECWNISPDENNVYQYSKKSKELLAGALFILDNKLTVFISYDFLGILKIDSSEQTKLNIESFRAIVEHFVNEYKDQLASIECLSEIYVELCCHSLSSHLDVGYISIENARRSGKKFRIDFAIDSEKLMKDISIAENRIIEYKMLKELFKPILSAFPSQLSDLYRSLESDTLRSKTVDTKAIKIDYYFNTHFPKTSETDVSKLSARKQISKIVLDAGILPGKYEQKQATRIVRKIQNDIVACLEEKIVKYNRIELHKHLLTAYSAELFSTRMNQESFNLSEKLENIDKKNAQQKSFYSLIISKSNLQALLYLIETNLYLNKKRSNENISELEIAELLSFALCIVELQNNSDLCFHTDSKTQLIVLDDYRIDVELGEEYSTKQENANMRRLGVKGYEIKGNEKDVSCFEKVAQAFLLDTGVEFRAFEAALNQLSTIGYSIREMDGEEISPNVLQIAAQSALDDYSTYVTEEVSIDAIKAAYDFITIDTSQLKTLNGEKHPYLPIWDRENRDNTFLVKPLLKIGEKYIFSPIMIDELRNRWVNGLLQFYPPYEIGLNNVRSALSEWKKVYEELFSSDVEHLFKEFGFEYFKHDVDIRREDRNGNHPTIDVLGDYDVIGLSKELKSIFVIECKVLQPIGSVFEHSNEQKRFFNEEKFDEKFQKRIDHLADSYVDFFANIGHEYVTEEYQIRPFMVVNKVFDSYYKTVSFPIVTYDELKAAIQNLITNH